jgi:hypothetical protein
LGKEADGRARLDEAVDVALLARGDQYHAERRAFEFGSQIPSEVEAALLAEPDVDESHVGRKLLDALHRLAARCGDPDDDESLTVEQPARGGAEPGVVVDDQTAQTHAFRMAVAAQRPHCSYLQDRNPAVRRGSRARLCVS